MKYALLVAGIAVCIGLCHGSIAGLYDQVTTAALSEEARLAIDVRCRDRDSQEGRECRAMLKKLYLSGSLDPDKTLHTYCESVKNARWGGSRPKPPDLCVRRYGGWREG